MGMTAGRIHTVSRTMHQCRDAACCLISVPVRSDGGRAQRLYEGLGIIHPRIKALAANVTISMSDFTCFLVIALNFVYTGVFKGAFGNKTVVLEREKIIWKHERKAGGRT